jgi:uncharacterized protein with HEPN domain
MGKPTQKERVEHVLCAINTINQFVADIDESTFITDVKLQSAVQFQFLLIGAAIGNIDFEILENYKYPWHIPRSFRNFIIHVYHGIKLERVYYAAIVLGELEKQMKSILVNEF